MVAEGRNGIGRDAKRPPTKNKGWWQKVKTRKLDIGKELLRNGTCFSGTALLSIACKALETPALKHGKTGAWKLM